MPEYTNAIYIKGFPRNEITIINVDVDGVLTFVPIAPGNTDYDNIMRLVAEGKITIQQAETSS